MKVLRYILDIIKNVADANSSLRVSSMSWGLGWVTACLFFYFTDYLAGNIPGWLVFATLFFVLGFFVLVSMAWDVDKYYFCEDDEERELIRNHRIKKALKKLQDELPSWKTS